MAVQAQSVVRGTVLDDASGETIPFADIFIVETGGGTSSDLEGAFSVDLDPGSYTFIVSFLGYSDLTINEVIVAEDKPTLLDVRLAQQGTMIDEVVVTAQQIRNNEAALATIKRKSVNVIDGISAQTFRKIGDGNAGAAIKRVTGVSVEGGKYVFVRGLGDRYTKSILNGMDVPGLDPDRNTLQMDIFPTNIIDNILVMKSFSPDLPGDFTGGVVNIETKDFPETRNTSISASAGYNPNMHFQDGFLTTQRSGTDFIGMDDGLRDLPIDPRAEIPFPTERNPALTSFTRAFNPEFAAMQSRSLMDYSVGLSTGNQINKDKVTVGYNLALSYKNETEFFDDVRYDNYRKVDFTSVENVFELEELRTQRGALGKNNVFASGLLGGAMKFKNHKISLTAIRLQNGENVAGEFDQITVLPNSNRIQRDNLEYSERAITNFLLDGKHSFNKGAFEVEWKVSPTFSSIYDKDVRVAPLRSDGANLTIEPSEGAEPRRIWRNLEEQNLGAKVDLIHNLKYQGRDMKIKYGVNAMRKHRDFSIFNYLFRTRGSDVVENGDPNNILAPSNIWDLETNPTGSYVIGNFEPTNTFDASQNIYAVYVMNELPISSKLKAVYGVRAEYFEHIYSGSNNLGDVVFNNEKILDELDLLPAVNLIYGATEQSNIRMSYYKTLARASFKENSIAQIFDAVSDRTFIGGYDIETRTAVQSTDVHNVDLRLETFQMGGQLISLSGFYKRFINPIEILAFNDVSFNSFTPRNVDNANVFGVEFEATKNLDFLTQKLKGFRVSTNVTLVQSSVKMSTIEFNSRTTNARPGEVIDDTRALQGQSPYIINAVLGYTNSDRGWDANLSYNVQGKRLAVVGIGAIPDVYEQPFPSLNLKVNKTIGKTSFSVGAENILGSTRRKEYESFMAENRPFEFFNPGRSINMSVGYRIH